MLFRNNDSTSFILSSSISWAHNDEPDFRMCIGVMIQLFFIFFPGAAGNNDRVATAEFSNQFIGFKFFSNINHPVEAGIAADAHIIGKADAAKQFL